MKKWRMRRFNLLMLLPLFAFSFSQGVQAKDKSIFSLPGQWKTEKNESVQLSKYNGKKTILTLFYATCSTICPMTVASIKRVEEALQKKNIAVQVIMISIDSGDQNSKQMSEFARHQQVNGKNWHLLAGKADQTSALAALLGLGIGEKRVSPDLHQMHSEFLMLLDAHGAVISKTPSLEPNIAEVVKAFSSLPKPKDVAVFDK